MVVVVVVCRRAMMLIEALCFVFFFCVYWGNTDEFAPVKDTPGGTGDTPEKARGMISQQAQRWLKAAGATLVGGGGQGSDDGCEISPLMSYEGEGLESYKGKEVYVPFSLS